MFFQCSHVVYKRYHHDFILELRPCSLNCPSRGMFSCHLPSVSGSCGGWARLVGSAEKQLRGWKEQSGGDSAGRRCHLHPQKSPHWDASEMAGAVVLRHNIFVVSIFSLIADTWEVPFEEISELQWLGSGAQGAVFLGKFRAEEVAIKKVRDQNETDIKHLRKLKHPNIIAFK